MFLQVDEITCPAGYDPPRDNIHLLEPRSWFQPRIMIKRIVYGKF